MSPSPRTAVLAVVALLLGVLALAPPLFLLAGLLALVLGLIALRHVNESDGRLRGGRLAIAAMILGGITSLMGGIAFLSVGFLYLRENANRAASQDNLRRIGMALGHYHDFPPPDLRAFPPAGVPTPDLPPEKRLSWQANLLAYLDRTPVPQREGEPIRPKPPGKARVVSEGFRADRAWDDAANRDAVNTSLAVFLCPANPNRSRPGEPGLTHYVGFSGVGADAVKLAQGDREAGFFGFDRKLTRAMLQDQRGASNVLVAAETGFDNGPWASAPASVRALDPAQRPYSGPGRPFGGLFPRGMNVLRADGSVHFQSDGIAPETFETLVRIAAPP
jgi:hypothetical protein